MFRLKILGLLAGTVAVLAVSAAPASAWFKAVEKQAKGKVVVTSSGEFVGGEGTAKSVVKCPASEIQGEWSIQTKGQIKQHLKQNGKNPQLLAEEGPHQHIQLKWGTNCVAEIGSTKFKAGEVKLTQCEFQLIQPQKGTGPVTVTAGIVVECRVKVPTCEIIVPAGMEKQEGSGEGVNVGLNEVKIEKNGTTAIKGAGSVTGIFAQKQVNALCPLTTNQKAELVGFTFEEIGATLV
ncbi:MAG TPA: hypothetical protein VIC06_02850 [Solirubrobacteraceae bacterium]|jgi:hypothetical protein